MKEIKSKEDINEKQRLSKIRRNNAKLFPVYKMFSWDLLFFYSIEILFYTLTKNVSVSEILVINGFYLLFRILGQLPAVMVADFIGKKKSIILGNFLLIIYLLLLIFLPGAIGIIIANLFFAVGYDIKMISEANLLYDSVATKGGEGLYSKLDSKGGSWYFILDGVASLAAGYLFVINNYIPIIICLIFVVISTILSFRFQDIYNPNHKKEGSIKKVLKEYNNDLKVSSRFILKSSRIKALILFNVAFYSLIRIAETYRGNLLIDVGMPEEQFSMVFAALTLIGGVSVSFLRPIEKRFKNRTLAFISLSYIASCIVIGAVSSITLNRTIVPLILIMYAIQKISTSIWYILEAKYLRNFTTTKSRNRISFTYEFISKFAASGFSIFAGLLLNVVNVENAFLFIGLFFLAFMIVVLDYMRKRIGLKPNEYRKKDINI